MRKQSVFCKENYHRLFDVNKGSRLNIRIKCSNSSCKCKTACEKEEFVRIGKLLNIWPSEYISHRCPICGQRLFDASSDSCGQVEIKCSRCKSIVNISIGDIKESALAA